jgi:hypothetical protein
MIKLIYSPGYQSIKEVTDEVKVLIDANHIINLVDALSCYISLFNNITFTQEKDEANLDSINNIMEDLIVNIQPLKKLI